MRRKSSAIGGGPFNRNSVVIETDAAEVGHVVDAVQPGQSLQHALEADQGSGGVGSDGFGVVLYSQIGLGVSMANLNKLSVHPQRSIASAGIS
jgi:hypothetical protein